VIGAEEIVVLGVGNILLSDDGLGVRALEKFKEIYIVPKGVSLIDGGTGGIALVSALQGKSLVIILDALNMKGVEDGKVVKLEGSRLDHALEDNGRLGSLHDIGMAEVLAISSFESKPPGVIVIGMTAISLDPGLELSPVVESGLSEMADMAARELNRAGINVMRRTLDECCK
jgi:hydrogenase maturation protease